MNKGVINQGIEDDIIADMYEDFVKRSRCHKWAYNISNFMEFGAKYCILQ